MSPVAPTTTAPSARAGSTPEDGDLRRLHALRFGFAVVWAGLLAVTASSLSALSVTLLLVYPLVDAAATAYDAHRSGRTRSRGILRLNVALSLAAAAALAVAAGSGIPAVLVVWGVWAVVAGLAQLVVAVQRGRAGGRWALVLSGAISVLAGAGFALSASGSAPELTGLAGYAALGGVFFLVSALRQRSAPRSSRDE